MIFLQFDTENKNYCCGNNERGQLGLGDQENRNFPQILPFDRKVIAIDGGGSFQNQNYFSVFL